MGESKSVQPSTVYNLSADIVLHSTVITLWEESSSTVGDVILRIIMLIMITRTLQDLI